YDTVNWIAADRFFHVHTGQIAKQHRRWTQETLSQRHDREFKRKTSCFPDATLHKFGEFTKMSITWREFRPGIANADHWPAFKQVVWPPLIFQPAAVNESALVLPCKPFLASESFHTRHPGESGSDNNAKASKRNLHFPLSWHTPKKGIVGKRFPKGYNLRVLNQRLIFAAAIRVWS